MSVFDDLRRDIRELVQLVRETERYDAVVMAGKGDPTPDVVRERAAKSRRIAELSSKLGINN